MKKYRVVVSIPCFTGYCNCNIFDGKVTDKIPLPPYHEGCTCYATELKEVMSEEVSKNT